MQTRTILAVIVLLTVTTFSCQKEDEKTTKQLVTGELKASNDPLFLLNVATDQWCTTPGSNCSPTVEIVSTKIQKLNRIALDPMAIAEYFSAANYDEWSVLFPYVAENANLLELLQSGKITFEIIEDPHTPGRYIVRMHNADNSFSLGFPLLVI